MFLAEYENVKDYNYDRYCRYLIDKYGRPEHDYFNPKCKRSSEGLEVHHVKEDEIPGLCERKVAARYDKSFQAPENLVCCDYLEHLFLHILIGEKTAGGKNIGLNGAFFHIIPAIKSYYDGEKGRYNDAYYKRLDGCEDVFDLLIGRYNKLIEETNVVFETNAFLYRKMENALNTKGRALVVLGTGLGKTTTALQYLWTHKCRALVICPNKLIESGWKERYSDWCDTVSFIGLARSYKTQDYTKYGVVIVDEAHHAGYDEQADAGAKIWSKGIKYILDRGVKVIGLTATLERSDAINVGKTLFKDCVCEGKSVEDAIDKGDVYPFSYISALYDAPAIAEEYKDCQSRELVGQLDVAINNTPTLKEIFAENMPAGERKGIIFIQDIADEGKVLEILKDVFPDAEYRAIHSKMPVDEVKTNREWFENTRSGYLLAVNMISEGAHYKGVNTLIMFRRTSSYLVFTQQLGRIITLTKDPDPHAIVFDLVNNVENVDYNSELIDKNTHSVRKIYEAIKRQAEKSNQVIVKDETRDIVKCIREIKEYNYSLLEPLLDRIRPEDLKRLINEYSTKGYSCFEDIPYLNKMQLVAIVQKLGLRKPQNKPFICIETGEVFNSQLECANKMFDGVPQAFSAVLKGRLETAKGYHFAYVDDTERIEEIRKKISNNYFKPRRNVSVICIETQEVFGSIKEAQKKTGIIGISNALRGQSKIAGGYHWAHKQDEKTIEELSQFIGHPKMKYNECYINNRHSRSCRCVETGVVYPSVSEAQRATRIGGISVACTTLKNDGQRRTAGGYHWEFVDEDKKDD